MTQPSNVSLKHRRNWSQRLTGHIAKIKTPPKLRIEGKLTRMIGLTLEAVGVQAAIGDRCIISVSDDKDIEAEVVGFSNDRTYLMPTDELHGLLPNASVVPSLRGYEVGVSDALLGRVLDGKGEVIDGKGPLVVTHHQPLLGKKVNPLLRDPISTPLDVGVAAINALFTVGRGQRLGLFAPSGVGKSVLLGMMTRYTNADVIVVGLIGERGREVKEFIENTLGEEGMSRAVIVAAPADDPPLLRIHGALLATSIAEYFRDQGKHVLLLMDSLTRFLQAQREIGLAIGEPPAARGYPPSVFAKLPRLVERAGNSIKGRGTITAFYTVLAEDEDQNDPISEAARAILDGHIVLSRKLADSGHYPAIDIEASISRAMIDITDSEHRQKANRFKQYFSAYQQNKELINIGAYQKGSNAEIDEAIAIYPQLVKFLQQNMEEPINLKTSIDKMVQLMQ